MTTIPAGTFTIDTAHSRIGFAARHAAVARVRGSFDDFTGQITIADHFPASTASVEIASGSVKTGNADRDAHLTSPDFWHSEQNPTWTFTTTGLEGAGEEFVLTGDLTINGVTKPVDMDVEYNGQAVGPDGVQRLGFSASTAVSRKEYGLTWNVALEGGGVLVGDKIRIDLDIAAVPAA
ncbi:polyisoprenoid-binding protein [Pseudactinotalea sp. HY160]|uniref:YceI family protein n=1 Tax=Pseudactinotalea sp. HY160 TaxID=2654490 RepID=UPI00128D26BC|nr:YceI family protein [Pseudactinotalea sp. HY160]MPV50476.1 polyisoprenoid-binding protein [Pseudactinotalea sp. HY160]